MSTALSAAASCAARAAAIALVSASPIGWKASFAIVAGFRGPEKLKAVVDESDDDPAGFASKWKIEAGGAGAGAAPKVKSFC
jgi:hypothetical protein